MDSFCEYIDKKEKLNLSEKYKLKTYSKNNSLRKLIDFIRKEKILNEKNLVLHMSNYFKISLVDELKLDFKQNLSKYFKLEEVEKNKIIVIKEEVNQICLGTIYPIELLKKEELKFKFKRKMKFFLMSKNEFIKTKKNIYNNYFKIDQNEILSDLPKLKEYKDTDIESLKDMVEDAPVVKLLNKILTEAISLSASDIHLEQKKNFFKIRYRIDGILNKYYELPSQISAAIISRIKIIAGMDITIRHLPQDGKLEFDFQNLKYDIRVSIIPTIHGEKAVLRLLSRNNQLLEIEELKFSETNFKLFNKIFNFKSGLILLSGPTGSGKTTTLFSILNKLAAENNNIITIENPVEYKLNLLNQIEINEAKGLKFPLVLRSVLRQDPDIIMIGEIRDKETAKIAIRAAVTGHLVLSTIHTLDSTAAVYRLLEIGIAPYLIANTLKAVISQRLLRKLCNDCKKITKKKILNSNSNNRTDFYCAVGCSECNETGYKGRIAAAEILIIEEELKNLISQNTSRKKLRKEIKKTDILTLYQSALKKVEAGISSQKELLRVIEAANLN